jgi:rSAM/selenodomain-associated transferase 2
MISVIIPAYNDEGLIKSTISHLRENAYKRLLKEIIVVDGGSADKTIREATEAGATVVQSIRRERAAQMNLGAQYATGEILYFLLPGALPPKHFTNEIVRATMKGFSFGWFTMKFNYKHWLLETLSWFTELQINYTRLDGQSLFVVKELFQKAGRFKEDLVIMEDREIIERLKRYSGFAILKNTIIAPTKKYMSHGILRTEITYLITWWMYGMGYSQKKLLKVYRSLMRGNLTSRQQRTPLTTASLTS